MFEYNVYIFKTYITNIISCRFGKTHLEILVKDHSIKEAMPKPEACLWYDWNMSWIGHENLKVTFDIYWKIFYGIRGWFIPKHVWTKSFLELKNDFLSPKSFCKFLQNKVCCFRSLVKSFIWDCKIILVYASL